MAYKTSHRLKAQYLTDSKKKLTKSLKKQIENFIEENENIEWVISEGLNDWGEDDRNFQNKNKIMKELSLKFPDLIFILDFDPIDDCRLGEYREYWFQGKIQKEYAEVKVNEFDSNKLKEAKGE